MLIHAVDVEANNNVTSCIITLSPIIDNLGVIYSFLCDFAQKLVHYRTSIHKCHFAIQPSFNWYSGQQLNYKGKWKCICSNIKRNHSNSHNSIHFYLYLQHFSQMSIGMLFSQIIVIPSFSSFSTTVQFSSFG